MFIPIVARIKISSNLYPATFKKLPNLQMEFHKSSIKVSTITKQGNQNAISTGAAVPLSKASLETRGGSRSWFPLLAGSGLFLIPGYRIR